MPRERQSAPPDPGIKPGGLRDRAMRALRERGPMQEDPELTRQSQEYWAGVRREREALAEVRRNGLPDPVREPSIWFACNAGGEAFAIGDLPEEYSKLARELRERGVLIGEFHSREEALAAARAVLAGSEMHGARDNEVASLTAPAGNTTRPPQRPRQ